MGTPAWPSTLLQLTAWFRLRLLTIRSNHLCSAQLLTVCIACSWGDNWELLAAPSIFSFDVVTTQSLTPDQETQITFTCKCIAGRDLTCCTPALPNRLINQEQMQRFVEDKCVLSKEYGLRFSAFFRNSMLFDVRLANQRHGAMMGPLFMHPGTH